LCLCIFCYLLSASICRFITLSIICVDSEVGHLILHLLLWTTAQADGAGDEVAEQLAAAFMWRVRCTVERLTGTAAAAQYSRRSGNKGVDTEGTTGVAIDGGALRLASPTLRAPLAVPR
jgi:hypothetical protein